ncbi:mechanosensitive ion channel family protein [Aureimonas sp. SK2]|uniref:mechanosensitive ion channel family protein n=1 Tax=Aureimonas sp. SK2 TaxID=3015992 RepID=UPI002443D8F3|nr:mechanosensitive ion channel family protein [Aureimonas sp. SK2]
MTSLTETALSLAPQIGASIASLLLAALAHRLVPTHKARTRRLCVIATATVLGLVWIAELQSLLLSLTAVAMALVLATKELIQCATGALAGRAGRSYAVGDRVHLDGTSGRVTAVNWLTTTIQETDARSLGSRPTGRRLVIPNSRMFSGGVHVEERGGALRHHTFSITLEAVTGLRDALAQAEAEASALSAPGAPEPRVALATSEFGKPRLDVVLFCAPAAVFEAERRITLAVLEQAVGSSAPRKPLSLVRSQAA